jgi:extracellular elastinolytic metalloproteinase
MQLLYTFLKRTTFFFLNRTTIFLLIALSVSLMGTAQNSGDNKQRAQTLLRKNLRATGLNQAAANNYLITDAYFDKSTGNFLVYLQQAHLGIPVYNKISVLIFRNDSLIGKTPDILRIPEHEAENGNYSVNPYQAIRFAANHLSIPLSREPQFVRQDNIRHRFVYRATGFTRKEINSDLVWLPSQDQKSLRLSWNVRLASDTGIDDWLVRVDAKTGEILGKSSYVVYEKPSDDCTDEPEVVRVGSSAARVEKMEPAPLTAVSATGSVPATGSTSTGPAPLKTGLMGPPPPAVTDAGYLVYPFPLESGNFGSRSTESNPWTKAGSGNNAISLGWQFDNSTNYMHTRGNNVWAQQD